MRVSEIRVKRIHVNQGLGVLFFPLYDLSCIFASFETPAIPGAG